MPSQAELAALRKLVADGLPNAICGEQLRYHGHQVTDRQIKRWREKHVKKLWRGSDADLDAIVQRLLAQRELGADEGYRWVHSVILKEVAPLRVGEKRVAAAIRRAQPAQVQARLAIVEKRLVRRQHHYRYYGEVAATDLNCKVTLGSVKLLIFGLVCPPPSPPRPSAC